MKNIRSFFAKFLRGIFNCFLGIVVLIISLIEVPLFFITHPRIFKNDLLYVFWHWSFGHTVSGLDYASRLYYPNRISVIFIPHPGSNEYLPRCFSHNMDVFIYRSIIPAGKGHLANAIRCVLLRIPLLILSGLWKKFHVLEHHAIYKTLSVAHDQLKLGNEKKGSLEKATDWTGYLRLLRDRIGKHPQLPRNLDEKCRHEITKIHPGFFEKPFVTLLLRKKGMEGSLDTAFRCAGPHENYVSAVQYLTENGYHAVGTGETEHNYFRNINGYFFFEKLKLPPSLLNLFCLTNCVLFIGQQSGASVLPNSRGILSLICDAMPYRLGTFRRDDIILFKHLREKTTDRRLSLVEVFQKHEDLAYGINFDQKKIAIEPNTSEEILEAVKECHVILKGQFRLSKEDKRLIEGFRALSSEHMHLRYHGNRTSLHMLHQLRHELIKD